MGSKFLGSIRRWPGDGIEQLFEKEGSTHHELADPCEVQVELTKILGFWPINQRFADMEEEGKNFFLYLPYAIQDEAAYKSLNTDQAIDHLFTVCYQPEVKTFLKRVGAYGAVKHGKRSFISWGSSNVETPMTAKGMDGQRMDEHGYVDSHPLINHGLNLIIAKLVHHNEDSDENMRLLFGSDMILLGPLIKIQNLIRTMNAPAGSPAFYKRKELLDETKLKPLKSCAHCTKISGNKQTICSGCKQEVFCSKECLKAEWDVHRVECYRVQGKEVTPTILAKAKALQDARVRMVAKQQESEKKEHLKDALESITNDINANGFGGPPTVDCNGVPRRKVLSVYWLEALKYITSAIIGLTFEKEILMVLTAPGLNKGDRQIIFKNPDNGALIVVSFTKLFFFHCDGPFGGIDIDNISVVKTGVKVPKERLLRNVDRVEGGEVEWTSVPEPEISQTVTNGFTLSCEWLRLAKTMAIHPTKDIFYHLDSRKFMREVSGYYGP